MATGQANKDSKEAELQFQKMMSRVRREILFHGWSAQFVPAKTSKVVDLASQRRIKSSFCYTAGLSNLGLPELIVYGISEKLAHTIFDSVIACLLDDDVLDNLVSSDRLVLPKAFAGALDVVVQLLPEVDVTLHAPLAAVVAKEQGENQPLLAQIIWPDQNGKFEWEEGSNQQLLAGQFVLAKRVFH